MDSLEKTLKVIINICLFVMTLVVTIQILSRYIFSAPLGWSEEVTRYLFIYMVFLSASVGIRTHLHIGVDILTDYLSSNSKKLLELIVNIIIVLFLLIVTYYGSILSIINMNQLSPSLGMPIGLFYAAIPIGSILGILFTIESIFKRKVENK